MKIKDIKTTEKKEVERKSAAGGAELVMEEGENI